MSADIVDVAALEACVGKVPGPADLKVMDHLDDSALRWLASSALLFAAFGTGTGVGITVGGGEPGFVQAIDARRLRIPAALLDEPQLAVVGQGFGALLLVSGICETLRINGRVAAIGDAIEIAVEECYLHCAKALMRSGFLAAEPQPETPADVADFVTACRFMALATIDAQGRADLSPKGDPAGTMLCLRGADAWYADRPGNRRVDSFRNILSQPHVAAVAVIPGSTRIALLSGRARITTDEAMCAAFTVGERTPKIVTRIGDVQLSLRDSAALARARIWPAGEPPADIDPAAMFVAHVKHSKARGLQATLTRAALSVPGLMEKGLQHDYKNRLY